MPTIKDIAEYAGVSHGTVSNVLNKRGNVSVEKINLVEQAARELGYSLNAQAKQLRQGHTRRICIVVPRGDVKRYMALFSGINIEARKSDYEVDLYFSDDHNYEEIRLLEHIITQKPSAVVLISTFEKSADIFNCDIPFIFVEREVKSLPSNALYCGFDYYLAGKEIAKKCVEDGAKNIAVFSEGEYYSNGSSFLEGIKEMLEFERVNYSCFASPDILKSNSAFELLNSDETYNAVITDCMERVELIRNVSNFAGKILPDNIYTLDSKCVGLDDMIKRYELNYKLYGKLLAKYIISLEDREKEINELPVIENDGFKQEEVFTNISEGKRINFLSLSSPTMQALKYLLPDFTKKTGVEVNIIEVTYDELFKIISTMDRKENSPYDLIRLDMVWLSRYAKKLFKPLDTDKKPYEDILNNFSNVFKDEYFKVDNIYYVLPFDPSVQILYYRRDLFENALICREFYEKYRRRLHIPQNYKEYDEVAEFFTKKFNATSPTKHGIALVYGTAAVAAGDFLPRWREKGGKLINNNGEICLNTSVFKETLVDYVNTLKYSDKKVRQWWNQAMESFAEGNTAMNIVFSNHASKMVLDFRSDIVGKVGFSAVPGKKPLLGGGVVGISKHTEKVKECELFFKWIYSEKIATAITSLGGYINHKNLVNNQEILQTYPWIEGMEKAFTIGERKDNSGIDEAEFEGIIGEAVRSAVLGIRTIDEVMEIIQKDIQGLKK